MSLSCLPTWYPVDRRLLFRTQEEADKFSGNQYRISELEGEHFAKRYDVASLIAINQLMPLSVVEWLGLKEDAFTREFGLPTPIVKGLAFEIARIGRERESQNRKQELDMKLKEAEYNSKLNFGPPNTSFGKVYS